MQLALGPLLYYWPRQQVFDFYQAAAAWPVDIVYLGEAVCSRRHEMQLNDWLDIAKMLRNAGKQPILSTMVLLESGSDVTHMLKIARNGEYPVEAGDMGAAHAMSAQKLPFIAGPHLNLFNADALEWIAELGATRWCIPLELTAKNLQGVLRAKPAGLQVEVFAHGRLPLAFSARCFTARHYNLPKDDCQFRCIEHADGLLLSTREGEGFLNINGIQIEMECFDSDGPVAVNTKTGKNIVTGIYNKNLAPGQTTKVDLWKMQDYDPQIGFAGTLEPLRRTPKQFGSRNLRRACNVHHERFIDIVEPGK